MSLNEIGVKFGTDKSSLRHHYLSLYEILFARFNKSLYVRILEIGIQFGNSLRTWREYWPYAEITGIDLIDNHIEEMFQTQILIGDAYGESSIGLGGKEFHIIIEDGSHEPAHQAFVLRHYTPLLSPDGILVIEDIASEETVAMLATAVPEGFNHAVIDLRTAAKGVPDNMLLLVWRKK